MELEELARDLRGLHGAAEAADDHLKSASVRARADDLIARYFREHDKVAANVVATEFELLVDRLL